MNEFLSEFINHLPNLQVQDQIENTTRPMGDEDLKSDGENRNRQSKIKQNLDILGATIYSRPNMRDEIDNILINNHLGESEVPLEEFSKNIIENIDKDKELLDALIKVQKAVKEKTLSKSIKRLQLLNISTMDDTSEKLENIENIFKGLGGLKLNLV